MNTQEIEEIYKHTFDGLNFFYRDTELSEKLISKYEIGKILKETGFTDMSYKAGGLICNLRYLIASANAKNVSSVNPHSAQFGHVILKSDSFFKILDIYKIDSRTQILLLEIPEIATELFASTNSENENELIQKGRKNFETNILLPPVMSLQSDAWTEGTEAPIGMSSRGKFFYDDGKNIDTNTKPWWKFWE